MKIKSISCDQFAGLKEFDLDFEDGMNIIMGKNEAGKSTTLELIYNTLFQSAKLNARTDAAFIDSYFPKNADGTIGKVIDGKVKLKTDEGTYIFSKEWDKSEGSCRLKLPDGSVTKSPEDICSKLDEIFGYSQGLMKEVVFPSQKKSNNAVQSILYKLSGKKSDELESLKGELSEALTKTALETGGVSIDKLEKELKRNVVLYGERWDFSADLPEDGVKRGINNMWREGKTAAALDGKQAIILRSYYDLKEIEKEQAQVEAAEIAVDNYKARLASAQGNKKKALDEKDNFSQYEVILGQSKLISDRINELSAKLKELNDVATTWPNYVAGLELREKLKLKLKQAKLRALYNDGKAIMDELLLKEKELSALKPVEQEDIKAVKLAHSEKVKLEGQLQGLNLVAKIKQLSDTPINIVAASSGENLSLTDGEIAIREAVEINIPGIMELQLMPQGVDIDLIKDKTTELTKNIQDIFGKYGVDSIEKLEDMLAKHQELTGKLDILRINLNSVLGECSWEELSNNNASLPDEVESVDEVMRSVRDICGTKGIQDTIVYYNSMIAEYERKYTSLETLHKQIAVTENDIENKKSQLDSMDDIPDEYAKIVDVDFYKKQLNDRIAAYERDCENYSQELKAAEISLGDRTSEEFEDKILVASDKLDNAKATYHHWKNIYDTFMEIRATALSTSSVSIEPQFKKYLDIITDGRLHITDMDDKLNVELASGNNAMTYSILSAGTKDTVALAFRLAMLEYMFPDGGGIAFFDDPISDMDPDRRLQACKLIEEFAKNNQVIFVTCDDVYEKLMDGNVIRV